MPRPLNTLACGLGLMLLALPGVALSQAASEAEARAHADAVIERAGAGAWFTNATSSDIPQVRHVPSGMLCSFPAVDERDVINIYPTMANGPAAGDDVGCGTWWDGTYVSMIASRYPANPDEAALIDSAVADIWQAWEGIEPREDAFEIVTFGDQPIPMIGVFTAQRNGQRMSNVLILRKIGDWAFKLRATGHPDDQDISSLSTFAFAISIPGGWEAFQAETPED